MWKRNGRNYTITYNSARSGVSSLPSSSSGMALAPNYTVTISNSTPTLSGYEFKGWCTTSTTSTSCSGTTIQRGGTITITSDGQIVNLYAMWSEIIFDCGTSKIPASPNATFAGKRWTTTKAQCTIRQAVNACPSGYHLPSNSEAKALFSYYGGQETDGLLNAGFPEGDYFTSTYELAGTAQNLGHCTPYPTEDMIGWFEVSTTSYLSRVGDSCLPQTVTRRVTCVSN